MGVVMSTTVFDRRHIANEIDEDQSPQVFTLAVHHHQLRLHLDRVVAAVLVTHLACSGKPNQPFSRLQPLFVHFDR